MKPASRRPAKAHQLSKHRCDCGLSAAVTPAGISGFEFAWRCAACGRTGVISWAHAKAPPTWTPPCPSVFKDEACCLPPGHNSWHYGLHHMWSNTGEAKVL